MKYLVLVILALFFYSCANQKELHHRWYRNTRYAQYLKDSLRIGH